MRCRGCRRFKGSGQRSGISGQWPVKVNIGRPSRVEKRVKLMPSLLSRGNPALTCGAKEWRRWRDSGRLRPRARVPAGKPFDLNTFIFPLTGPKGRRILYLNMFNYDLF